MSDLIAPGVTLTVGLIAAGIARQQWVLARRKLKLDLFERRYRVYDATRKFLSVILSNANFEDKDLFEFYGGTSDSTFLFGKEITSFLDKIRDSALDMRCSRQIFSDLPVGDERTKHVTKHHNELKWLNDQIGLLRKLFHPYLGFDSIK